MTVASGAADTGHVVAAITFIDPLNEKPFSYTYEPPVGRPWRNATYSAHNVAVHDARRLNEAPTLDSAGFALAPSTTSVRDFYDDAEVRATYYPEVERLVLAATGAERVVVFDHNVRNAARAARGDSDTREPVTRVHNDYTLTSAPKRLFDLLPPDEALARVKNRFAIVNVWRPIRGPVQNAPLAVADARSLTQDDFIASDLIFLDRIGETYAVKHGSTQRWFYYPQMRRDEVLFLKCYDSATDGRARFTAHGAFDDPTAPSDAPPRESIEARTLVLFPPTS
ncbi:CmcJ/NvfI family oxidoreductase [Reyranella sp. CPCC 100927]|uniref:CmcJ/NvfI family oxidoreductase n=1 Tax=Reyranella sp. CPCC 100927 TaxID=2599616 RepID=UPI0011B39F53|nr:CmcJ/NvfI family oxidoreductase [Reyranella sp. CPCC 100927]TWT05759.1 methyltransferase [Reyranella sp. CPCC 100927]